MDIPELGAPTCRRSQAYNQATLTTMSPAAGARLGPYTIVGSLGQGEASWLMTGIGIKDRFGRVIRTGRSRIRWASSHRDEAFLS